MLRSEFTRQPRLGGAPLALRRRGRHLQHVSRFFDGEPAKRAEFHDLRQAAIDGFQALERIIQREHGYLVGNGRLDSLIDRHALDTIAPLARVVATGVVDEDPPHDLCGDTKEMRSTPPIDLPLIDESQVRFVDERRRLQGVAHPLAAKLARAMLRNSA